MTKISFLNTQSLLNKFDCIKLDLNLHQSDVILLAETWIAQNEEECKRYELENYEVNLNNAGRGKGLATYHRQQFQHTVDLNDDNISMTRIESTDIDVIAVYRSQNGSWKTLINNLQDLINLNKTTLIVAYSICSIEQPKNKLCTYLKDITFKQIVKEATHIDGGHIDHAYIINKGNYEAEPDVEIVPKYYSDHDALCFTWKKMKQFTGNENHL